MKEFVRNSGKDPSGSFKASNKWVYQFTRRYGISKQKKTNKKSKSVKERLPAVHNFHWWAIYQMALKKPQVLENMLYSKTGVCKHHHIFLLFFPDREACVRLSSKSGKKKQASLTVLTCIQKNYFPKFFILNVLHELSKPLNSQENHFVPRQTCQKRK